MIWLTIISQALADSAITTPNYTAPIIMRRIVKSSTVDFILAFYFIAGPLFYMSYHGWANKNLLDTAMTDTLAKFFYVFSSIFVLVFYFKDKGML